MRVLIVHERYRQRGGEDAVVEAECRLLRQQGVTVELLTKDNAEITGNGSLALAAKALWSPEGFALARAAIARARPDVLHVHNSFPLLSPSIYDAARRMGVPVIQTLHNYRFLCPNALLLRNGTPCEACVGRVVKWPGVRHGCYRDSRAASAAVAAIAVSQRLNAVWRGGVHRFIALTPFAAARFARGGIPAERLTVRPPLLDDPAGSAGLPPAADARRGALFVGRLSQEKGVATLLAAWQGMDGRLDIVGDGPLLDSLRCQAPPNVHFHGKLSAASVAQAMAKAALLVVPSLCYENFPLVVVEAMARGLPVLASSGGAAVDMLGPDGAFAQPGDAADWRRQAARLLGDAAALHRLSLHGRNEYERRYAPDRVMAMALSLYRDVRETGGDRPGGSR